MGKVIRNVLRGFSSIGGVYPVERNLPKINTDKLSAEDAMREDWNRVGNDIRTAMRRFENEQGKAKTR